MATAFSSLPILDIGILGSPAVPSDRELAALGKQLYEIFATTGFAYLVNAPLSFGHDEVFQIAREFFALSGSKKMEVAKRSFRAGNGNTYRGYVFTKYGADM